MKLIMWIVAITLGIGSTASVAFASEKAESKLDPTSSKNTLSPWDRANYSYAYWLNGWRKNTDDTSADILCFETGHYGMTLDVADFSKTRFGLFGSIVCKALR